MLEPKTIDDRIFSYNPRLSKVKRFVDANLTERVSLDLAARVAGLEKTYFSKYFREKTGSCFRDWLSAMRVKRAMEFMTVRDLSITEIAFTVGFQDLRTFERAVERCTGLSPRAVKNRLRPRPGAKAAKVSGNFPITDGYFTTVAERFGSNASIIQLDAPPVVGGEPMSPNDLTKE